MLKMVGVRIHPDSVLLTSLTRACRLCNDHVTVRLPVRIGLLTVMLKALQDVFVGEQLYLISLYRALFITAYYGLFRIGELTESPHIVKAVDVQIGVNKDKLMFILHTSKMHGLESKLQIIKIDGIQQEKEKQKDSKRT